MQYNYIIKYKVLSNLGDGLKSGTIKVKNVSSDSEAKIELEKMFRSRYVDFGRVIFISCDMEKEPIEGSQEAFEWLKDMFNGQI